MDGTAPTWWTLRESVGVVLAPQHLKRTGCVALIVGNFGLLSATRRPTAHARSPRADELEIDSTTNPASLKRP
jgi:hypothetical protein